MEHSEGTGVLHERYDWLDQARGLVVLLLIVSMPTAEFSGDVLTGDPTLGPPMLNHGYDYFDAYPPIITFIDIGQALFMLVMGFVGYTAFTSRLKKRGPRAAFWYGFRRVSVLYALASIDSLFLPLLEKGRCEWDNFLYKGTFSMIAFGAMASFVCTVLVPNADKRIRIGVLLMLVHSLLYAFPLFDRHTWADNLLNLPHFPFGLLGLTAVAIAGGCYGQWHVMDPENPIAGFQKRIVPISSAAFVGAYCMDWMQPAQHHDVNASLQLQALYMGGFMLMIFFAFGRVGFRFPLLSSLGKNLLLMFAVGGLGTSIYVSLLPKSLLLESPFLAMTLAGIVPIAVLSYAAVWLDRRGIMVRA
ncbi:MAG: hypothetical protein WC655_12425 [Candidatus Hydrogenedentales bacterium]|jgi:hypothetical protein